MLTKYSILQADIHNRLSRHRSMANITIANSRQVQKTRLTKHTISSQYYYYFITTYIFSVCKSPVILVWIFRRYKHFVLFFTCSTCYYHLSAYNSSVYYVQSAYYYQTSYTYYYQCGRRWRRRWCPATGYSQKYVNHQN